MGANLLLLGMLVFSAANGDGVALDELSVPLEMLFTPDFWWARPA